MINTQPVKPKLQIVPQKGSFNDNETSPYFYSHKQKKLAAVSSLIR